MIEDYLVFRDAFAEVIDSRYHTIEWLDRQVLTGVFKCSRSENAAIITEFRSYPTGAIDIHGIVAAGSLKEIVEILIPDAEEDGREQGCIAALIESRPGWVRELKPYGYEMHQTIVRKEL